MENTDSDPLLIELMNHVHGNTWVGILFGPIEIIDSENPEITVPMPNPLARVDLHFVKAGRSDPSIEFSSEEETAIPIVITDASAWEFKIDKVDPDVFSLQPGIYYGDVTTTDSTGFVLTIYRLKLEVLKTKTILAP